MNLKLADRKSQSLLSAQIVALALMLSLTGPWLAAPAQAQRPRQQKSKPAMKDDQKVAHVLTRLTFGARPGDFARVKAMGVEAFIKQQLESDSLDETGLGVKLRPLPTLGMATPVLIEQYTPPKAAPSPSPKPAESPQPDNKMAAPAASPTAVVPPLATNGKSEASMQSERPKTVDKPGEEMKKSEPPKEPAAKPPAKPPEKNPQRVVNELQRAALLRAIYSDRQLYEVMVNFWENHFSVFANKDADRLLLTSFDRDTIRPFALGRFRDLLGATAHSPAMLFYLDNWRSSVPRPYPATKDKPAGIDGGLNENYARELMELHTLGVDGGYTQKDVQEVARCFSGWTIQKPNEEGLFLYRPGLHDNGEKVVLGHKIPAGGGIGDGERVLDILASHPATARFIATKLARRFISDDPPPAVIDRAAATFLKTDGSIRETLRIIVTAPEFFAPAAYRAKIRTPFEYVVAALRATGATTDADAPIIGASGRMGQPVFGRITPDGYPDRAEQWLSAGAMLERFNFATALATNRLRGTKVDTGTLLDVGSVNSPAEAADRLTAVLLDGDVTAQTRDALAKLAQQESANQNGAPAPLDRVNYSSGTATQPAAPYVAQLLALLIGSPEFQRR